MNDTESKALKLCERINNALNKYFFCGRFNDAPVYINIENDARLELSDDLGVKAKKIERVIGFAARRSLRFDERNPYSYQEEILSKWNDSGRFDPPPFTALLCAFTIAAERMGVDDNYKNNYYERLFEVLLVRDGKHKQKLRSHARDTRKFWDALNLWLRENDCRLGRPTARAIIRNWQYASYGLSQALVREADRKRFAKLFERNDFVPGGSIPAAEMELCIHEWMGVSGSAGPTSQLWKLWAISELRPRVVDAALDAFGVWGRTPEGAGQGAASVRLALQLRFIGFPRKRMLLSLAATRSGGVEDLEDGLRLSGGNEEGVQFLGPSERIDLASLLLQSREFKGSVSKVTYRYVARPIIPFVQSAFGDGYREVSRVGLFGEHAVLCYEAWLAKVAGHLRRCAREGYVVLRSSDVAGIPDGWCVLRGVEIVQPVECGDRDFHALTPIASNAVISCVGGLSLGQDVWHVDFLPRVLAFSDKKECEICVVEDGFGDDVYVALSSKMASGFAEINLDDIPIVSGDNMKALVKSNDSSLAELSLSFRSADVPRPINVERVFHRIAPNIGFLLGGGEAEAAVQCSLEGCCFHGNLGSLDLVKCNPVASLSEDVASGAVELPPDSKWGDAGPSVQDVGSNCVARGYHHWKCRDFNRGDKRCDVEFGTCLDCNVHAVVNSNINRNKLYDDGDCFDRHFVDNHVRSFQYSSSQSSVVKCRHRIHPDIVYDGLCYFGYGKWGTIERLASAVSIETFFPYAFASDLFSLGNIEMQDAFNSFASEWSVPPPVLVVGYDQSIRLSGFHSKSLLERLKVIFGSEGARYEPVSAQCQVTVHRWSGVSVGNVASKVDGIIDKHGRRVVIVDGIARIIAGQLPFLENVWMCAAPMSIERVDLLERFDLQRGRWVRAEKITEQGAYRIGMHGTRYAYCDGNGSTRQVGYRIAKVLAASANSVRLHGYDARSCRFVSMLGADPPGLFARAIVASSGQLPRIEDGRLIYENVDPVVADAVLGKMYTTGGRRV